MAQSPGKAGSVDNLDPCPGAPPAPSVDPVFVCPNNSQTIHVQYPNISYTYKWYDAQTGGNLLATGSSFITPIITADTVFYVEAVNGSCASPRTYVSVTLITSQYPIIHDTTICAGNYAVLKILNPVFLYLYNWYTSYEGGWETLVTTANSYTTNILYHTATYWVDASLICHGYRVPVTVTVIAPPASNDVTVCKGSTATLTVQDPAPNQSYNWYSVDTGGTLLSTGSVFITGPVLSPVTFFVETAGDTCNNLRTPVNVNFYRVLDTPLVRVEKVSGSSMRFSWQPVAGATGYKVSVNGSNYVEPSSGNMGTTHTINNLPRSHVVSISVIALGLNGCDDSAPGHAKGGTYADGFFVPSAFTPNGDGLNDILTPIFPNNADLDYFTVYNRWGQRVFSTSKLGEGWNGKSQGIDQALGTYVWICRFRLSSGKIINEKGIFIIVH